MVKIYKLLNWVDMQQNCIIFGANICVILNYIFLFSSLFLKFFIVK